MSVSRKLFLTIAGFVIALSLVFLLAAQLVVHKSLEAIVEATRGQEINALTEWLSDAYREAGPPAQPPGDMPAPLAARMSEANASLLLLADDGAPLYAYGGAERRLVERLGVKTRLERDGGTAAELYYYDPEVANLSKLRIGITVSVTMLQAVAILLFVLLALLAAYWLSRKLTAPLRHIIATIDRLAAGELGAQAAVVSRDEYGKVAAALNELSLQLKRSETSRNNMVADVAHELRTPLTIVRGNLELIQQSGKEVRPESLLPIHDELLRLSRLIDDLQQLALAEAHQLAPLRRQASLLDILQNITQRLNAEAEAKQIRLTLVSLTDDTTLPLDPHQITQAFFNLAHNAIRYTPAGGSVGITVEAGAAAEGGPGMLQVAIADTGPGIPADKLPFVFERFYRTDEARSRNSGGMGLGLAIAKQFVLAHHGSIEAESRGAGYGSTFIVKLPVGLSSLNADFTAHRQP